MTNSNDKMDQFESLKQDILENYERLNVTDSFKFECKPGLECFGTCCGDVNIFLTPYDVLRLKKRLGISSEEFVARYAISPPVEQTRLPVIVLRMQENAKKSCPFVGEDGGCSVYEDRPTPCRMYPIGQASGKTETNPEGVDFFFKMQDDACHGTGENKDWTVAQWMADQGVDEYNEMNEEFKEINLNPYFNNNELPAEKMQMYFMALYNIDMFRRFLFDSRFFSIFTINEDLIEKIKTDDDELLKFSYRWLRFSIFGEKTLDIPDEILDEHNKKMVSRAISKKSPENKGPQS